MNKFEQKMDELYGQGMELLGQAEHKAEAWTVAKQILEVFMESPRQTWTLSIAMADDDATVYHLSSAEGDYWFTDGYDEEMCEVTTVDPTTEDYAGNEVPSEVAYQLVLQAKYLYRDQEGDQRVDFEDEDEEEEFTF